MKNISYKLATLALGISAIGGHAPVWAQVSTNDSINQATTINTGSSTGAVTIGNQANSTSGTNAIEAKNNNLGVATANSINTIGNASAGTSVTARGGTSTLSVAGTTASLTAGPTLATNGATGAASGNLSGGLTVYNAAQPIGAGTTILGAPQGCVTLSACARELA